MGYLSAELGIQLDCNLSGSSMVAVAEWRPEHRDVSCSAVDALGAQLDIDAPDAPDVPNVPNVPDAKELTSPSFSERLKLMSMQFAHTIR